MESIKAAKLSGFVELIRPHSNVRIHASRTLESFDVLINREKPSEEHVTVRYPAYIVAMRFTAATPTSLIRFEKRVNPKLIDPAWYVDYLELRNHHVEFSDILSGRLMGRYLGGSFFYTGAGEWSEKVLERLAKTDFDAEYERFE